MTKAIKQTKKPESQCSGFLRTLTLLASLAVLVLVVLYPRAIATDASSVPHGALVILLFGMSAGWVYGFGFIPQNKFFRILFSPFTAWGLMGLGVYFIFF